MPPKNNPLRLNKLQLKALTIMQAYVDTRHGVPDEETDGEVTITMPPPHGDHFHVGESVVFLKDATGFSAPCRLPQFDLPGQRTPP